MANSTTKSVERLVNILTDPRVVPLHFQLVLGQDDFSPILFAQLISEYVALDLENLETVPEVFGVYGMIVKQANGLLQIYFGSGCGTRLNTTGHILLPRRLGEHYSRMKSDHTDLQDNWNHHRGGILHVHLEATRPGATSHFGILFSLRPPSDPDLVSLTKCLTVFAENLFIAGVETPAKNSSMYGMLGPFREFTNFVADLLREKGLNKAMPGLNKCLPAAQVFPISSLARGSLVPEDINAIFDEFFASTQRRSLASSDRKTIRAKLPAGVNFSDWSLSFFYRRRCIHPRKSTEIDFISKNQMVNEVLRAGIKYFTMTGQANLEDGRYSIPSCKDIDFQHMAISLQYQMQDHIITEDLCRRLWMETSGNSIYASNRTHVIYEKENWEGVQSKLDTSVLKPLPT